MKIKINYKRELFKGKSGLCESVFCAPFEDSSKFDEESWENKRFQKLIEIGKDFLEFVDIQDCDFVVLPYKWDNQSVTTSSIIHEAKKFGKKIIALHNDDYEPTKRLNIEDGYLFTTTLQSTQRHINEFSFPAFTGDFFENKFNINRRLGFCGAITHPIRGYVLDIVQKSTKIESEIILRTGFWAPELEKNEARNQYMRSLQDNTFILCMRGAGNFSYRLYETLMMGRIPIIINSNQVFPFENKIDYSKFSLMINSPENIENQILNFLNSKSNEELITMQKTSRNFWQNFCSPEGWTKNFTKEL